MGAEAEQEAQGVSIHAGFPNPAADKSLSNLDLNQLLIQHAHSTYLFRMRGRHWEDRGIFDGDIAVIDRALDPRKNDTVIWWHENDEGYSVSKYQDLPADANLWGVVTSIIHQFRGSEQ